MATREIIGQFTVEAATPEGARTFVAQQLRDGLRPGEEGSAWSAAATETPRYGLARVREVRPLIGPTPRGEG